LPYPRRWMGGIPWKHPLEGMYTTSSVAQSIFVAWDLCRQLVPIAGEVCGTFLKQAVLRASCDGDSPVSLATQVRAAMASASGVAGIQRCCGEPRQRFPRTTYGSRVVVAHRTRSLDFYGQILLWTPKYAHERPVREAWLGCRNVGRTPSVGLLPPQPVFAS